MVYMNGVQSQNPRIQVHKNFVVNVEMKVNSMCYLNDLKTLLVPFS